ncbi:MAG TPA: glycine zipper 2TM domain-containing protein [Thiobacillus sp.]|nr:glycine zipper 2TM domain-containing protein [Thiobacillus sp.]HQT70858.1 glycine zipper 2TM domain-containing protein [Thiobacillus sp.]
MKSRPLNTALIAALLAASGAAQADRRLDDEMIVRAPVVDSVPVYDTINEPRRECWTETTGYETQTYRNANSPGGAILGAIAGGLLGSTVGKGDGRVAAAAVGAATGAVVGDRWNGRGVTTESRPTQVERCTIHDDTRQVLVGYDVRYRFNGREFMARLPYDPGDYLKLNVSYSIAEDPRGNGWKKGRRS